MAMEVEVLGVTGAPDGAILSVRAGGQRRQAPVAALGQGKAAFRFATGPSGANPFRVDLLQPAGSARLALRPGEGSYSTVLKGPSSVPGARVEFAICAPGKRPSKSGVAEAFCKAGKEPADAVAVPSLGLKGLEGDLPPAAAVAKDYLEKHSLLPFVRALLQTVIRERPDDPFSFIEEQFRNASKAGGGDSFTTPRKPPPTESKEMPVSKTERCVEADGDKPAEPADTDAMVAVTGLRQELQELRSEMRESLQHAAADGRLGPTLDNAFGRAGEQKQTEAEPSKQFEEDAKASARTALLRRLSVDSEPTEEAHSFPAAEVRGRRDDDVQRGHPFVFLPSVGTWYQRRRGVKADVVVCQRGFDRKGIDQRDIDQRGLDVPSPLSDESPRFRPGLAAVNLDSADGTDGPAFARHSLEAPGVGKRSMGQSRATEDSDSFRGLPPTEEKPSEGFEEDAKASARNALQKALFKDVEPTVEDMNRFRVGAAAAGSRTALGDCQEANEDASAAQAEIERIRTAGQIALEKALLGEQEGDADEEASPEELERVKSMGQDALERSLLGDGLPSDGGEDEEPSPEELQRVKTMGQDALERSLLGDGLPSDGGEEEPSPEELERAKSMGQDALERSLLGDGLPSDGGEEEPSPAELERVKTMGQEALERSLLGDSLPSDGGEDEDAPAKPAELERVRTKGMEALEKALLGEDSEYQDPPVAPQEAELERVKTLGQDALEKALLGETNEEEPPAPEELERIRTNGMEALEKALLGENEEPQPSELDRIRTKSADALEKALLGDSSQDFDTQDDFERAKTIARDALSKALMVNTDSSQRQETPQADIERAKTKAQDALTRALLDESSSVKAPSEERELERVKTMAQDALDKALSEEFEKAPEGGEEQVELERVKTLAQEALGKAFSKHEDSYDVENLRTKTQKALAQAILGLASESKVEGDEAELERVKSIAQDALERTLVEEEQMEIERVKTMAQDALEEAFAEELREGPSKSDGREQELEAARNKASKALLRTVVHSQVRAPSQDVDPLVKNKARDALKTALLSDSGSVSRARSLPPEGSFQASRSLPAMSSSQESSRPMDVLLTGNTEDVSKAFTLYELQQIQMKTRDALNIAPSETQKPLNIATREKDGSEELKTKARDALNVALSRDKDDQNDNLKGRAQRALEGVLLQQDDVEELKNPKSSENSGPPPVPSRGLKRQARSSLEESMDTEGFYKNAENTTDQDEAARARKSAAMEAALFPEDNTAHELIKAKARRALSQGLLEDESDEDGDDEAAVEEAKAAARKALKAVLIADKPPAIETSCEEEHLKAKARRVLSDSLLGTRAHRETLESDSSEANDEAVEEARAAAKTALSKVLGKQGSERKEQSPPTLDTTVSAADFGLERALRVEMEMLRSETMPPNEVKSLKETAATSLTQAVRIEAEGMGLDLADDELEFARERSRRTIEDALFAHVEMSTAITEEEMACLKPLAQRAIRTSLVGAFDSGTSCSGKSETAQRAARNGFDFSASQTAPAELNIAFELRDKLRETRHDMVTANAALKTEVGVLNETLANLRREQPKPSVG